MFVPHIGVAAFSELYTHVQQHRVQPIPKISFSSLIHFDRALIREGFDLSGLPLYLVCETQSKLVILQKGG